MYYALIKVITYTIKALRVGIKKLMYADNETKEQGIKPFDEDLPYNKVYPKGTQWNIIERQGEDRKIKWAYIDQRYPNPKVERAELRVAYEKLETMGFDAGGGEILYYQGQPFTGTIVEYRDGVLVGEEEFKNGHVGGAQRSYHQNGQLSTEDFVAFNKPYGFCREWDQDGTLIFEYDLGPEPKLRVAYEELETMGFDAGGGEILYYQGQPFTGTIVEYRDGVLVGEEDFKDGHINGAQRTYYKNGQMMSERYVAFNRSYGLYREWDENGTLTYEKDCGPEVRY